MEVYSRVSRAVQVDGIIVRQVARELGVIGQILQDDESRPKK